MIKKQIVSGLLIALILGFLSAASHAAVTKMSQSKICHPDYSPYYARTKNFTAYPTLQACLNAGGRLPKGLQKRSRSLSSSSSSKQPNHIAARQGKTYQRSYFGHGWADVDHDCQNSRMEALIAQSTAPVRFATSKECRITAGRWISPFTNAVIHDASTIDIDHVVPLKWAWIHGADRWPQDKRERFANDPGNLLSVEASLNRQKGAKGPRQWLPPRNQCQYVLRFQRISKQYQLEQPAGLVRVRQKVCQ